MTSKNMSEAQIKEKETDAGIGGEDGGARGERGGPQVVKEARADDDVPELTPTLPAESVKEESEVEL